MGRLMRRGFSLIELIVVIGVIAILMALLMPVLSAARERARTIQCAGQLHQLGVGFFNYAAQNRSWLPGWSGWEVAGGNGTGDDDDPGPGWGEVLAPYYAPATSKVYDCPSFPEGYRFNYFIAAVWLDMHGRQAWRITEIQHTSNFVLSGDCTGASLYAAPFGSRTDKSSDDCDKDDAVGIGLSFATDKAGGLSVHHGGNNVLFADGHVEWRKKFDTADMTCDPEKMLTWDEVKHPDSGTNPP